MSTALPEALPARGKADQRHEYRIGNNVLRIARRLEHAERPHVQALVVIGIAPIAKAHRTAAIGKPGQGNPASVLEKPSGVGAGRRFGWLGVIEAHRCRLRRQGRNRSGRAQEQ